MKKVIVVVLLIAVSSFAYASQRRSSFGNAGFLTMAPGTKVSQPKKENKPRKFVQSKIKTLNTKIEILELQVKGFQILSEKKEAEIDTLKSAIKEQKAEITRLKKLCRKAGILKEGTAESSTTKILNPPGIGKIGYLRTASMTLAIDKKTHDELLSAVLAQDKIGYDNLVTSGRAFIVPNKAKVLVIDRGLFIRKVRILEGEYTGRAGWISYEEIAKSKK